MTLLARARRPLRRARSYGRRLAFALAAVALLVSVARTGASFYFCEAMVAVASHCCCEARHAPSGAAQLEAPEPDCCKRHTIGALPAAATRAVSGPPSAPLVAVLPPLGSSAERAKPPPRFDPRGAPTGPPPLSPSSQRARLMVFTI